MVEPFDTRAFRFLFAFLQNQVVILGVGVGIARGFVVLPRAPFFLLFLRLPVAFLGGVVPVEENLRRVDFVFRQFRELGGTRREPQRPWVHVPFLHHHLAAAFTDLGALRFLLQPLVEKRREGHIRQRIAGVIHGKPAQ